MSHVGGTSEELYRSFGIGYTELWQSLNRCQRPRRRNCLLLALNVLAGSRVRRAMAPAVAVAVTTMFRKKMD